MSIVSCELSMNGEYLCQVSGELSMYEEYLSLVSPELSMNGEYLCLVTPLTRHRYFPYIDNSDTTDKTEILSIH
jgi:hypothetical protein